MGTCTRTGTFWFSLHTLDPIALQRIAGYFLISITMTPVLQIYVAADHMLYNHNNNNNNIYIISSGVMQRRQILRFFYFVRFEFSAMLRV